jgi:hypothetical protein
VEEIERRYLAKSQHVTDVRIFFVKADFEAKKRWSKKRLWPHAGILEVS